MSGEREKPAHVLIVDDEHYNRELLKVMLASDGFELETAVSGDDALQKIRSNAPDLILLDAMMPGMDGFEFARRIKEKHATRNIPIIMVSAADDRESRLLGLGAGAEDFLTKPIDRMELGIRIRNLLRLKAYSDHLVRYNETLEAEVTSRSTQFVERRKAPEQRISANEERASYALDVAGIGVWEIDMTTDQLIWSPTMQTVFGINTTPESGQQLLSLVHPNDRAMLSLAQDNCASQQIDLDITFRVIGASGRERWIESRARCRYNEQGTPIRMIGVSTDITLRKDAALHVIDTDSME